MVSKSANPSVMKCFIHSSMVVPPSATAWRATRRLQTGWISIAIASLGLRNRLLFFRGPMRTLFLLPMVVPAVVLSVGMQVLLSGFGVTKSYLGVIIAHTVVAVPFVVVSVTGALAGIDGRVERAAQSLGASPTTVFRRLRASASSEIKAPLRDIIQKELPLKAEHIIEEAVLSRTNFERWKTVQHVLLFGSQKIG